VRWLVALTVVPTASARVPDPCSLVTKAEASRALGESVRFRQSSADPPRRRCSWLGAPILGPSSKKKVALAALARF
jgi:hypothetical protein